MTLFVYVVIVYAVVAALVSGVILPWSRRILIAMPPDQNDPHAVERVRGASTFRLIWMGVMWPRALVRGIVAAVRALRG